MNGYDMMAKTWEKIKNEGKCSNEVADKKIRVYEFLANCDKDDIQALVDSSAFNNIIADYIKKAVEMAELDEESKSKVMEQVPNLFDF